MTTMRVVFVIFMCSILLPFSYGKPQKHPVIIVPGDGGSQLEVKLNKTTGPHFFCERHTSSFSSLWLNLEAVIPELIDCFVDNMRLKYDNATRTTRNNDGVYTHVPGFGDTSSVEWLDPSRVSHLTSGVEYFYTIVTELVNIGFKRGVNVRGAPYDFRKAPNELGGYYANLTTLIEDTFKINNDSPVVVVGHSLGNPTFLYFLNQKAQSWKDKYIKAFVTLAGVWGGTPKPLRLFSSGDNLGIPFIEPLRVRPEQRSMPSTAFLLPTDKFWNSSEALVITDKRNYTVADYKEFFNDLEFLDGYDMWQDTRKLIHDLKAPGVPVHCLHGYDLDTPATFVFGKGQFPDTYPKTIPGPGDGTVLLRSLLGCLKWITEQPQPVKHLPISKAEHMGILKNDTTIKYILAVATGKL